MQRVRLPAARVTPEVAEAFDRLATRRGVTNSALMQALGERLVTGDWEPPNDVIRRARAIDRERGSRR